MVLYAHLLLCNGPCPRTLDSSHTLPLPPVAPRQAYREQLLDFLDAADGVQTRRAVMLTGLQMGMPGS